jgi:hypothetical protein
MKKGNKKTAGKTTALGLVLIVCFLACSKDPASSTPPPPSVVLKSSSITDSSVSLSWTRCTDNDFASYIVFVSDSQTNLSSKPDTIITSALDTMHVVTGLSHSTRYYCMVRTTFGSIAALESNVLSVTTLARTGVPLDDTPIHQRSMP